MSDGHDAVILAAGGSRRLGRPKQLLTAGGETLVARVTRLVLATHPSRILVIVGAHAEAMTAALDGYDVEIVTNEAWATGMASSLRKAAGELAGRDLPVLITVVDQPALDLGHLMALLAAHSEDRDTVTTYRDALGVPALLRAATLARANTLDGDMGFRHLWSTTTPRAVRADELAEDLDEESDITRAIGVGLLDRPTRPT